MGVHAGSSGKLASFFKGGGLLHGASQEAATPNVADSGQLSGIISGSWFFQFLPSNPTMNMPIRGPVRIDGSVVNPRISGDIYVGTAGDGGQPAGPIESMPDGSLVIGENWYPSFPQQQYVWYFRSVEVTVEDDELRAVIERHIWDPALTRFVQSDMGGLALSLEPDPVAWPNLPKPAPIMRGQAMIAGEVVQVTAIKTSDFFRGCVVEVDVMENRDWPASASDALGTRNYSFESVFRDAGLDFITRVSDLNLPEDSALSALELHTLLRDHREPTSMPDVWRLWLLVGSSWRDNSGVLGIMFDSTPPHREGTVGFYDPRLSSSSIIEAGARGKRLGEVSLAFLRTLIHEAGHALNLFHPKDDVHGVEIGTTIMNQTGDVLGFATVANPYPGNASMHFNEHNLTSLIHGPDPQTKPGWLRFGWGHSSGVSTGIEEPTGLLGLNGGTVDVQELELELDLPDEIHRGEIIVANVKVRNRSDNDVEVSTALNLAQDDLEIVAVGPDEEKLQPRDVIKICGARDTVALAPGDSIENAVQLFFNNGGFTFAKVGTYEVWARFRPFDNPRMTLESARVTVNVRNSVTRKEQELETLMLDTGVGLGVAFGDFGANGDVEKVMSKVASDYKDTDTGSLCAMVVSNSLAKPHRNAQTGEVCRGADPDRARKVLDEVLSSIGSQKAFELSMATVVARDMQAPLLDMLESGLSAAGAGRKGKAGNLVLDKIKKLGMRPLQSN